MGWWMSCHSEGILFEFSTVLENQKDVSSMTQKVGRHFFLFDSHHRILYN